MPQDPIFLVSIMRNEGPYVLEFVAHYKLLGFSKIFIATNNNTDRSLEVFQCLADGGMIEYFLNEVPPLGNPQKSGYRLCLAAARSRASIFYVYPVDADEFLYLTEDIDISSYVSRFPDAHSISFNWRFYGSDGHKVRPAGLVMENYHWRCSDSHRGSKTLKTLSLHDSNLRGFGPHFPHHFDLSKVNSIYSDGQPINPENFRNGISHQNWTTSGHGLAILRHYGIKSLEEYAARKKRGSGKGESDNRYQDEYFNLYDKKEIYDPMPSAWVQRVKEEMWRIFHDCGLSRIFPPSYFGLVSRAPPD
ncbi:MULTISPECIES: glycosyltransferase family 2 protein [Roseomonadaceae]|uniref:Glycosyltransferase family 2 protein n=1 Tax=Falsiroseomonas oleicola TaxID=2801474 RepID=A0ABS6HF05_9PROT|nr:glycosyltransferase family 2 protein [Roseomonas oleicola]MBU8547284.1 glycosyltransferase family 2 protein [Roseomonas oleicola]